MADNLPKFARKQRAELINTYRQGGDVRGCEHVTELDKLLDECVDRGSYLGIATRWKRLLENRRLLDRVCD